MLISTMNMTEITEELRKDCVVASKFLDAKRINIVE